MTRPARYDEVADFYEEFAPDVYDEQPLAALLQLIGDVSSLRLLDLACGNGRLTRELARRGAQMTGIDISAALLEKARDREAAGPLQIRYVHADAAESEILKGEMFAGVVCSFALSDIDRSGRNDRDCGAGAATRRIFRVLDAASVLSWMGAKAGQLQLEAWTRLL